MTVMPWVFASAATVAPALVFTVYSRILIHRKNRKKVTHRSRRSHLLPMWNQLPVTTRAVHRTLHRPTVLVTSQSHQETP
jgi:hypothetical protein